VYGGVDDLSLDSADRKMEAQTRCHQARTQKGEPMPGKRVQFDEESWRQIDLLGHDQMKDFQELADEAFRDLLKKYGRPVDLKDALRRSAGVSATVHQLKPGHGKKPRRK
jgi:hypothetical protein